jgi:hypothetical protein
MAQQDIPGYVGYKRREFCRDVGCRVQAELDSLEEGSDEYEKTRRVCAEACKFSAWKFHHWLTERGYVIVKPDKAR